MQHTQQQLNALWDKIISGRQSQKAAELRKMTPPGSFDVLPMIVVSDPTSEVMSVPAKDNTDRAVYARKPGGQWVELP